MSHYNDFNQDEHDSKGTTTYGVWDSICVIIFILGIVAFFVGGLALVPAIFAFNWAAGLTYTGALMMILVYAVNQL